MELTIREPPVPCRHREQPMDHWWNHPGGLRLPPGRRRTAAGQSHFRPAPAPAIGAARTPRASVAPLGKRLFQDPVHSGELRRAQLLLVRGTPPAVELVPVEAALKGR
jgi:hypothetical protein